MKKPSLVKSSLCLKDLLIIKKGGLVHCAIDYIFVIHANAQNVAEPFEYFLNREKELYLQDCDLSLPFLEKVAKVIGDTTIVQFKGTPSKYRLNAVVLMTLFPNVKRITSNVPIDLTWNKSITLTDQHNLKNLEMTLTLEQCKMYSVDAIEAFLRAQKKGFYLCIIIHTTSKNCKINCDLEAALKRKFKQDYRRREGFTQIELRFNNIETFWYLTDI